MDDIGYYLMNGLQTLSEAEARAAAVNVINQERAKIST
jgi:hypothetical protein